MKTGVKVSCYRLCDSRELVTDTVHNFKYLGIILVQSLNIDCLMISRKLGILYRIEKLLTDKPKTVIIVFIDLIIY